MDNTIDAIGLVSSILIAVMFVPQVVHVHRTKDTRAINYSFLFLNMLASSMGLIYSIHFRVVPMIVANTSAGLFSVSLAGMKYVNEVKEKIPDIDIDIVSDTPALMV
jgi:uncharacterized protein with PQ loop repeat